MVILSAFIFHAGIIVLVSLIWTLRLICTLPPIALILLLRLGLLGISACHMARRNSVFMKVTNGLEHRIAFCATEYFFL